METTGVLNQQKTKGVETVSRPDTPKKDQARMTAPQKEITHQDQAKAESLARDINDHLKLRQSDLKIRVDSETGEIKVKIVSKEDGRIIREIPPENLFDLVGRMDDVTGVLLDKIS